MSARYQIVAEGGVFDFQARAHIDPIKNPVEWVEYLSSLTKGEVPLPPDAVGQMPLDDAKAARVANINAYAAGLRNRIIAGRSGGEMASWALKLLDALAVRAGTQNPFAALLPEIGVILGLSGPPHSINDALAQIRGISEAEHTDKVITQAVMSLVAEVSIDPVRGRHCDAVAAMTDVRDVVTYNWLAGWPAVPQ